MKALICGVSGQDGSYLAKLLLEKGYEVVGTSRDSMMAPFSSLVRLGIRHQVRLVSMAINDFRSVLTVIDSHRPDEIYNLAGQTSVGLSFEQPVEAMESITQGTLNMLEAIRFVDPAIRFYNAGSSECYGDTGVEGADEQHPFLPRSPYAVAKASAYWLTRNYRESYSLHANTGILFNHESPLRPERFVTQKIIRAAARIALGSEEKLNLGNIDIHRDWGWAPDYVDAMWRMLQQDEAGDYVVATGESCALEEFVRKAFLNFDLSWHDHVITNRDLFRPSDIKFSCGNPHKAKQRLNWSATHKIDDVIAAMCSEAVQQEISNFNQEFK